MKSSSIDWLVYLSFNESVVGVNLNLSQLLEYGLKSKLICEIILDPKKMHFTI